ncbi:M43 family zinc metalloprotease [Dyadobacter pollutisoli]|uniref:M43 family zinc metalloprotease n=1 Tax=Dyadobacter pollutisoli TaxID=2910158 RepID=A0A9E8NGT5_9BACT|nr:M43 family zinc metalloprotease [Dyadobacter pollutisoli]WAC15043.1 M43 family zinc metalloprotease [Dyadobacter pollutisoli]
MNSQNHLGFCGYKPDSVLENQIRQLIRQRLAQKQNEINLRTEAELYKIPVVVHVIEPSTASSLITDAGINSILANLNDAYRGRGYYFGSPDVQIEFELAKYGPDCSSYPAGAITRFDASGNATYVSKGVFNQGVSWGQVQSWVTWDKDLYLNIWIVNRLDNGASGVGGPGEGLIGDAQDMQEVHDQVAPHEVGHYLGIGHPFPSLSDCGCGDGDGLADTPPLTSYGIGSACDHNWWCSDASMALTNPCTNAPYGTIQKNIMNYLGVGCAQLFTNDQLNAMRATLETYHETLLTSPVLGPVAPMATAIISGPDQYCTLDGFPTTRVTCICSEVASITRNGSTINESGLGTKPLPSAGNSTVWDYTLKCANGLTASKSITFYNPGIKNVVTTCSSESTWQVQFENPGKYIVTSSAGSVVGNTITGIPNTEAPTVTVTDAEGCGNSITLAIPCCAQKVAATAQCSPTAPNGLSAYFGLTNFTFGSINKNSGNSQEDGANYVDRSCTDIAVMNSGNLYPVSVRGNYVNVHRVKVYIDYNNDGIFTTDLANNELAFQGTTAGGDANFASGNIMLPSTAVRNIPLRVRVLADPASTSDACTIIGYNTGRALVNFGAGQIEDFSITIQNPLPVTLISFEGTADAEGNKLTWETAQEEQNKGFEIERSPDGHYFETKGFVAGNNTTSIKSQYSFRDADVQTHLRYFYRLKQLDFDGGFVFSRIIDVANSNDLAPVYVFPNPIVGQEFHVAISRPADHDLFLISLNGTQIPIDKELSDSPAGWTVAGKGGILPGLYTIKIQNKFNRKIQYLKVVAR